MSDILIQSDMDSLKHKMRENLPENYFCYWNVNGKPQSVEAGEMIKFSDGDRVVAKSVIISVKKGRIEFEPLRRADEELPVSPPDRGFKYITEDAMEEFQNE